MEVGESFFQPCLGDNEEIWLLLLEVEGDGMLFRKVFGGSGKSGAFGVLAPLGSCPICHGRCLAAEVARVPSANLGSSPARTGRYPHVRCLC